jgi:hypothetical protein
MFCRFIHTLNRADISLECHQRMWQRNKVTWFRKAIQRIDNRFGEMNVLYGRYRSVVTEQKKRCRTWPRDSAISEHWEASSWRLVEHRDHPGHLRNNECRLVSWQYMARLLQKLTFDSSKDGIKSRSTTILQHQVISMPYQTKLEMRHSRTEKEVNSRFLWYVPYQFESTIDHRISAPHLLQFVVHFEWWTFSAMQFACG